MSWFRTAQRGAAFEFGRRLWAWFAAYEIGRAIAARLLPTIVILTALALAVWTAARFSAWWLPRLAALAIATAALGIALWAWRCWKWRIRAGQHRTAVTAAAVTLAGTLALTALLIR